MVHPPVEFGIVGFGLSLGDDQSIAEVAGQYVHDPERIARWGYHTFHRAPAGTTSITMAAQAAQQALAETGTDAQDVDLVVLVLSEMPDYHYWDSSAALARELKIHGRQTLLLNEGCASGVTGLGMVAGLLAVQPELQTVLYVAVNRVSEYHRNRMTVNSSVHSDGAVAAVLRRGHGRNRWLATEQLTDPEYCDFFRGDFGAAVTPEPPAGWSSGTAVSGLQRVQEHFERDPGRLRDFVALLNRRVVEVIEGACSRAGVQIGDLARFVYINDSPDSVDDIGKLLGLPIERTNAEIAAAHGHMGAADQLISLALHLQRGEVAPGDLVALSGISIGMRWYCSLIEV
jgi:3-oxoacyl-[acyl-carrier-protein] synthase-3